MLSLIIFGAILLIGIVLLIIDEYKIWFLKDSMAMIVLTITIFAGLATIIMGTAAIVNKIAEPELAIEYNDTINEINLQYEILTLTEDENENNYVYFMAVNSYNAKVKDFKNKIKRKKSQRDSLWLKWAASPAVDYLTGDEVLYIECGIS